MSPHHPLLAVLLSERKQTPRWTDLLARLVLSAFSGPLRMLTVHLPLRTAMFSLLRQAKLAINVSLCPLKEEIVFKAVITHLLK